jgi:hypothetical protein
VIFENGQRVIAPEPNGSGEVEATVAGPAERRDAVEVMGDDGLERVESCWVRYDDGTQKRWPCGTLRPVAVSD